MSPLLKFIPIVTALLVLAACKQSDPPDDQRDGDTVTFAGKVWDVKHSTAQQGPGPNFFSDAPSDVFVDQNGWLHLKIANRDNRWYATEVVGQENIGYGTYTWTVGSDVHNIPENLVVGLFTWDNNSFQRQANSEIDVEFSYWGDTTLSSTLSYSAQPVNFGTFFPERHHTSPSAGELLEGVTTHTFTWTDTLVTWASYEGESASGTPFAEWSFDLNNPARSKQEGGNFSDFIVIPAPGETTNARINFWILPHINAAPTDGLEHELVIRNFTYLPL